MSLKERVYSVLVVSASDSFNSSLMALLPKSTYQPVQTVTSISAAKRAVSERAYDFVIINAPLPDEFGTHFAIDTCVARGTIVLLFVKNDVYAEIYDKVAEHGVYTMPKPVSKSTMFLALRWMTSTREYLRRYEEKSLSIEEKMNEIRLVNRAKWLLISELKMDEPDAHRFIEKQAMNRCVSKREIAEEIIKAYSK